MTSSTRGVLGQARGVVVKGVRWVATRRHRFPAPVNRALDWLRWHLPSGLVWRLTGRRGTPVDLRLITPEMPLPPVPATARRLIVGPTNYAGQGHLWGRAASRELPDTGAVSFALHVPHGFDFPADYIITAVVYRKNSAWQREMFEYVAGGFTHAMIEAVRPLFADLYDVDPFAEAVALAERGVATAMMCHGTDVRQPSRHGAAHTWSPYNDRDWDVVDQVEAKTAQNLFNLRRFEGPIFASTPDLLDDVPNAVWCPVVVEPDRWTNDRPLLDRPVPIVAHVPSNSRIKGTDHVEAAMARLDAEGRVIYEPVRGVPSAEMPTVYSAADIVLDQFRLGSYGVAACEAMAAGKVVVGNVTPEVRERVREQTGHELPIVQALPDEIEHVVRELLEDRDRARAAGAAGPAFVRAVHDGRLSAQRLAPFLGVADA